MVVVNSYTSVCQVQHIKGINKEHILCPPCHHEMGISMDIDEYESVRMYQSLQGDNEFSIYCHVSDSCLLMRKIEKKKTKTKTIGFF